MDDRERELVGAEARLLQELGGVRLGEPRQRGGLGLVPVYHDGAAATAIYQTLAAAIKSGDAIVREQPDATVPTLQVANPGPLAILILDGEEVVGRKQNRVINATLLVPPRCTFDLPVSCVEHGRWHDAGPTFDAGEAAYPTLRRQKMEQVAASVAFEGASRADQGAVWDEIATRQRRQGTRSGTGTMRDLYLQRDDELAEVERALGCPDDGPVGVLALIGGRAHCADLFDRAETLRAYWPRLVRSYTLEATDRAPAVLRLDSARRLLGRPQLARRSVAPSAGLSADVRLSGNGVVGAALIHAGAVVHAALFRHGAAGTTEMRWPSVRVRAHIGGRRPGGEATDR